MAETSFWWTTNDVGDGPPPATGYDREKLAKLTAIMAACSGFEGVAPGFLNSFSSTTASEQATISTGGAVVDGRQYMNDSAVNVAIPAAVGGGNTRIDRIVLRANWTAQTVRIHRIAGTNAGSPTAPAITQTSGTTYDITLYQALVNTSGVVTLTDERVIASHLQRRQGGSAGGWTVPGTTNYVAAPHRMQVGVRAVGNVASTDTESVEITFPAAFAQSPVVTASVVMDVPGTAPWDISISVVSNTGFTATVRNNHGGAKECDISWTAVGPI
jgi:hypothetical protein